MKKFIVFLLCSVVCVVAWHLIWKAMGGKSGQTVAEFIPVVILFFIFYVFNGKPKEAE